MASIDSAPSWEGLFFEPSQPKGLVQNAAKENRGWFLEERILALSLLGAKGSGKSTLLAHTIHSLMNEFPINIISAGAAKALSAEQIKSELELLRPRPKSILFFETDDSFRSLVDYGEKAKVVLFSIDEGADKPLESPKLFQSCRAMVLNKMDLLPNSSFSLDRCLENARQVNPKIRIFLVSALQADGLYEWYEWLREQAAMASYNQANA